MSDFNIEITPMGSVSESHYFRGLIMGSAHVGKTSCVLMTAPKPTFVINCDKQISLNPGTMLCLEKKIPLKGSSVFVKSFDDMETALKVAKMQVKEKGVKTVVLDTVSGYSKILLKRCIQVSAAANRSGLPDGRKYWPAYHDHLESVIDRLHALDAHIVVCAHWEDSSSGDDDDKDEDKKPSTAKAGPGIVPLLGGKSRLKAGTWFEDVLFMEKRKGEERVLRCSIDGVWGPASKSLPGISEVPADISAFIKQKDERLRKLLNAARGTR